MFNVGVTLSQLISQLQLLADKYEHIDPQVLVSAVSDTKDRVNIEAPVCGVQTVLSKDSKVHIIFDAVRLVADRKDGKLTHLKLESKVKKGS